MERDFEKFYGTSYSLRLKRPQNVHYNFYSYYPPSSSTLKDKGCFERTKPLRFTKIALQFYWNSWRYQKIPSRIPYQWNQLVTTEDLTTVLSLKLRNWRYTACTTSHSTSMCLIVYQMTIIGWFFWVKLSPNNNQLLLGRPEKLGTKKFFGLEVVLTNGFGPKTVCDNGWSWHIKLKQKHFQIF